MTQRLTAFCFAAATAILLASCVGRLTIVLPAPVRIATAAPTSSYYPVGNAICRIVNLANSDDPSMRCQAILSDGAAANVRMVRNRQATFGLAQSDLAYGAYRGEASLTAVGPDPELRTVVALQRESFTVVTRADSGIRTFQDLRGKRIGIGKVGAGYTFTRDVILRFYDWTISDFERALELGPTDQGQTLCARKVDAIIFEAAHPDGMTQEAATSCGTRLVEVAGPPVDRLIATHPYYVASAIPGGLYAGSPKDTPTFGTQTLLITSSRQPDDVVYATVKAVFDNFADLKPLYPALSTLTPRDMVPREAAVPIHPGALRYFREVGLLP